MKRTVGTIVMIALAIAVGFFLRDYLPSGGPPPGQGAPGGAAPPPPAVRVQIASLQNTEPQIEYVARVEPIREVMLKAQVSGILGEVHFTEGEMVDQGDLLFTIDPAEYEALVAQARAQLLRAEASAERAEKYLEMLKAADSRSISRSDMDMAEANASETAAAVQQAKADLDAAEIKLGYTKIHAPISGQIGKALVTKGNYVSPGSDTLAHLVQLDPIRVVFAMPDTEYLTLAEELGVDEQRVGIARLRLPNGTVLPQKGLRDFEDNRMNVGTGTIDVHVRFENKKQLLVPDGYVSLLFRRFTDEKSRKIVLPQSALLMDADGFYVWTVDEKGTAVQTRIVPRAMIGQDRVIESGLEEGQRVVVSGIQKVRPGAPVSVVSQPPAQEQ